MLALCINGCDISKEPSTMMDPFYRETPYILINFCNDDVGVFEVIFRYKRASVFRGLDEFLHWNDPMIVEVLVL